MVSIQRLQATDSAIQGRGRRRTRLVRSDCQVCGMVQDIAGGKSTTIYYDQRRASEKMITREEVHPQCQKTLVSGGMARWALRPQGRHQEPRSDLITEGRKVGNKDYYEDQVEQSSIKRARRLPCRPYQLRAPADGFINLAPSPARVPSGLFGARGTVVHELHWKGKSRAGRAWQRTLLRSEAVMSQVRLKRA